MNTHRLNALIEAQTLLIQTRDTIKKMRDLEEEDYRLILGPMGDSIADCEYLIECEYERIDGNKMPVDGYATS